MSIRQPGCKRPSHQMDFEFTPESLAFRKVRDMRRFTHVDARRA
jgi:hypothetical protein